MSIDNIHFERIDAHYEYECGAYDEDGEQAFCDRCNQELMYNPIDGQYVCDNCEISMSRAEYFNFIGAEQYHRKCVNDCGRNYPHCRSTCPYFDFDVI